MKLYELQHEFEELSEALECLTFEDNEATSTLAWERQLQERLVAISLSREEKLENIIRLIKSKDAMMEARKAEIKKLKERNEREDAQIEWLKNYLKIAVEEGKKFDCPSGSITWRKSSSVIIDDEFKLSDLLCTIETIRTPDKKAIKEAIQEGKLVEGAHLETKQNLSIK